MEHPARMIYRHLRCLSGGRLGPHHKVPGFSVCSISRLQARIDNPDHRDEGGLGRGQREIISSTSLSSY